MPPSFTRSSAIGLDEAGVRGRALVRARRALQLAVGRIGVPVALRRAGDAVRPVQAGVEPLRRVRRGRLQREHRLQLVVERARVLLGVEVPVPLAPVGPAAREPAEDLARVGLAAVLLVGRQHGERLRVGLGAAQPRGHAVLGDGLRARRGTPALRQYFWARMSTATWDHAAGAWTVASKTTEPSGLTIRDVRAANSIPAYGSAPASVYRRPIFTARPPSATSPERSPHRRPPDPLAGAGEEP